MEMNLRTYVFVLGVKVSGYIQYMGLKTAVGVTIDNAFNNEWLEDPLHKEVVVIEAYRIYGGALVRVI
jgi:hypothetical protein